MLNCFARTWKSIFILCISRYGNDAGNGNHSSWWISGICLSFTHWGRVTHICVVDLTIIGSDNGLSPGRHQAIIWTNAGILLIGPLGTNFSEILIEIQTFSLKKIRLQMSSVKCCSFLLGLNVLIIITMATGDPVIRSIWSISSYQQYFLPHDTRVISDIIYMASDNIKHYSDVTGTLRNLKLLPTWQCMPHLDQALGTSKLHIPLWGESTGDRFPSQRASNVERIAMSWPHHAVLMVLLCCMIAPVKVK